MITKILFKPGELGGIGYLVKPTEIPHFIAKPQGVEQLTILDVMENPL